MNTISTPTTEPRAVRVRIRRFDPETDRSPRFDDFEVPYTPRMRIIDALNFVQSNLEEDIGYRWLCSVKKCGTCAVQVNGAPKLACWEAALPEMTIEPLNNLPVIRDLVVDRAPYEAWLAKLSPQLVRDRAYSGFPEPATANDFAPAAPLRDCIQCLACQSVCPVVEQPDSGFAGPAPLVALAELAQHPYDEEDRAELSGITAQIFKCVSCYRCDNVCPAGIPVVGAAIEPLKRLAYRRVRTPGARRAKAFLAVVKKRGVADGGAIALRAGTIGRGNLWLALRLILRGKLNPLGIIFNQRRNDADAVRRAYRSSEDSQ